MKIRYIGDGKDSPLKTTAFGYFFVLNEATDVTDDLAISKLSGNKCFEVVKPTIGDLAFAEQPPVDSAPEQAVEPVEPVAEVPVIIRYAKPRGRPRGPSRT